MDEQASCCAYSSRNFLIFVNLIVILVGLCLLAGSIYVWVEYERQFAHMFSTAPIIGSMIAGIVLLFLAALGIHGVVAGKRRVFIGYLAAVTVLICMEIALGAVFLEYRDFLSSESLQSSAQLTNPTQIGINDFIYRSYQTCCVNTEFCSNYEPDENFCLKVPFCSALSTTTYCIKEPGDPPSDQVEIGICTTLKQLRIDGTPIVGPVRNGNTISCGGGNPKQFESVFTGWVNSNIAFFGYGMIGLVSVQLIIVMVGVYLLYCAAVEIGQAEPGPPLEGAVEDYVSAYSKESENRLSFRVLPSQHV